MLVWRIAHESAEHANFPAGPYACSDSLPPAVNQNERLNEMFESHCDREHPSPYNPASTLGGIARHERCGFDSRESLYQWFANYTEALDDAGFCVFVYDLPDHAVRIGTFGQVVFDKYEAIERKREPLDLSPAQLPLFA
ncbi:hypothetical protein [Streptomyces lavendulae]|uniref:hypothetical protein n=1 Tax=Streptomyces lavendulae TaxID=1914 RepID=UPI00369DC4B6